MSVTSPRYTASVQRTQTEASSLHTPLFSQFTHNCADDWSILNHGPLQL